MTAVREGPVGGGLEQVSARRRMKSRLMMVLILLCVAIALVPLIAVTVYTVQRGWRGLSGHFFTQSMKGVGPLDPTGGAYHAIIGTVEQVGLASLISVPLGLLVAIDLVEYPRGAFSRMVRFVVDVMTGVPSIVAGLFIFAFWVLGLHQGFSGLAASFALAVLMLPVVVRSSEEMLKIVPGSLREAALALGIPKWRTIVRVVLPSARDGIITGVMLAVARVTGETAPLLLTAFGTQVVNNNPFKGAQSALPLFVFQQAGSAFVVNVNRAWAGALTLILVVVLLNVLARSFTARARIRDMIRGG
ncbi:MAG TPA: phosphate ABC transporter permease PstA [Acidimicrobiales bacterium]|nr:phosphate ABC transporter permease PstA [Acidimicrobiales bacterium]